jgi:hypothetical protein|uniref:PRORP domain-containing protein n=1 Tax=viral metagenome TaxID=1070528 RepID=A0A6C0EDM1_9ZZZZ
MSINELSKNLYINLNSNLNYIYNYNNDNLIDLKNNGIISLLILYYIKLNDSININYIINKIKLNDLDLLKRDYLNILDYYNLNNEIFYQNYLIEFISKIKNNPDIILNKDLDYLIKKKIKDVLLGLNGLFIKTSNTNYNEINTIEYSKLNFYKFDNNLVNKIILFLENNFSKNINYILNNMFIKIKNIEKICIIDGGNVINNYKGKITNQSLQNLENIVNKLIEKNYKPLIILHNKHIKNINNLDYFLKNKNIYYFLSPFKFNDDIFILWFFFKFINNNIDCFIISNDNFNDHINIFKNFIFDFNFKNIFKQYIINYTINPLKINDIPTYSSCIQIIYDTYYKDKIYEIFIPHVNNFMIKY